MTDIIKDTREVIPFYLVFEVAKELFSIMHLDEVGVNYYYNIKNYV